jgi:hypothetical protein
MPARVETQERWKSSINLMRFEHQRHVYVTFWRVNAINHGEFAIHGFRNRDLRAIFFPQTTDDKQQRRRHSAWISRKLRLLRSHALITKIGGTHRYQLTSAGRRIIVAILSALRSTVAQLTPVTAQLIGVAA